MKAVLQDDDSRDQSDIVIVDTSAEAEHSAEQLPDSDFDDFDSGDEEEEASMEAEQQHGGSQDNEIHEIYLVQDSKQTRVMGKQTIAQMLLYKTGRPVSQFRFPMKVLYKCQETEIVLLF